MTNKDSYIYISGTITKALRELGSLLEILDLKTTAKSNRAGIHSKSWRERVSDFSSRNIEAAGAE